MKKLLLLLTFLVVLASSVSAYTNDLKYNITSASAGNEHACGSSVTNLYDDLTAYDCAANTWVTNNLVNSYAQYYWLLPVILDEIMVFEEGVGGWNNYELHYSTDNITWTFIASKTNATEAHHYYDAGGVTANYLRINITDAEDDIGRIGELNVSGSFVAGDITAPVITFVYPADNSLNNTWNRTIQFTTDENANTTVNDTDVKLISTGTTNHVYNFTGTITTRQYLFNFSAWDSENNNGTSTLNITLDVTSPTLVTDFINNTVFFGNITGQFNFSDNNQLYSFNISIGGTQLAADSNLSVADYSFNLSYDSTQLPSGSQIMVVRYADAHTAVQLKNKDAYNPSTGFFSDYINYNFKAPYRDTYIKMYLKDHKLSDDWSYKVSKDRYSEIFYPTTPSSTQTFIVESDENIEIVSALHGEYGGQWLVIGDHWKDFVLENEPNTNIQIKRINKKKVEVTITGIQKPNKLTFSSTGDLNVATTNYTIFIGNYTVTSETNKIETTTTRLTANFTFNTTFMEDIFASLIYNGTVYAPTKSNNTNHMFFDATATIPLINSNVSNISFFWNYTIIGKNNNETLNTSTSNQLVYRFSLDNCTYQGTPAINFTFYDEENPTTKLNTNSTSTFTYNVVPSVNKTNITTKLSENNSLICIDPNFANITSNYVINYGAASYPIRRYDVSDQVLNSNIQTIPLYLLSGGTGIYVIFKTVDNLGNPIEDVQGTMRLLVDSVLTTMEIETTDSAGLATFFANPNTEYTFIFAKTGLPTQTINLRPTTSEIITITMGGIEGGIELSGYSGVDYFFTPNLLLLNNNTPYNFTFDLNTSSWNITSCTLTLKNSSEDISSSSSSFSNQVCSITIELNTLNRTQLIASASYSLNNTVNDTVSIEYAIISTYEGTFSFKNFIDDINAFTDAGFNDFTRMFIAFIAIFSIMVWITRESLQNPLGLSEKEGTVILLWALVLMFSYFGWFTLSYEALPEIRGLASDWLNQYIMWLLITLAAAPTIIKNHIR